MTVLANFSAIVKTQEPLAPYTYLKVGGPAEFLAQPRSVEELAALFQECLQQKIPVRVLGGGCNILVPDEGVHGLVLRLTEPAFTQITVEARHIRAGAGASLSALVGQAARAGLAGLETLVGIPGSVGGAVRCNAGDRSAEIGQFVRQVEVFDRSGSRQVRERDELHFDDHGWNLDDPIILSVELELDSDQPDAIHKRMLKAWIHRKAAQPLSFQAAGRIFRNPRGMSAGKLIEQAVPAKTRVGGAEISERDSNFIIAHSGASARDVRRLIDLARSRVKEKFNVELELEIGIW
jgi:UDP-N-acetylmuramate dehydrogenase